MLTPSIFAGLPLSAIKFARPITGADRPPEATARAALIAGLAATPAIPFLVPDLSVHPETDVPAVLALPPEAT